MQVIHTYNDGSRLNLMSSTALLQVPIWKGNRIIDTAHVKKIADSVGDDVRILDSGYRLISYNEEDSEGRQVKQTYVCDGQHRLAVLRSWLEERLCEPPFDVTVTEIEVGSEGEAIEYFNRINNVKPIQFKEDVRLVANKFIAAIEKKFTTKGGVKLFRSVQTHRPYMSVDKLRDALIDYQDRLTTKKPAEFAAAVYEHNKNMIRGLELGIALGSYSDKEKKMAEKCIALGFALAFDGRVGWMKDLLP